MSLKEMYEQTFLLWGSIPGANAKTILTGFLMEITKNPEKSYNYLGEIYLDYPSYKKNLQSKTNFPQSKIKEKCIERIIEENDLVKKFNIYKRFRTENEDDD